MQLTVEQARSVFVGLGVNTAKKWQAKRLESKISKITDLVDDDTDLEGEDGENLNAILTAIDEGEDIEITEGDDKPAKKASKGKATKKPAAKKGKASTAKKKADDEDEDEDDEPEEKPAKRKRGTKRAAKKASKGKATKKPAAKKGKAKKDDDEDGAGPVGVRYTKSRAYYAGVVIAEYGLDDGITEEMVQAVDEYYGRENPAESQGRLRNAWHIVQGYLEGQQG